MQKVTLGFTQISLIILGLAFLQACSAKEQPLQGAKIGMHIDAVLEFVIEYPLDWTKDRRLRYGSNEGEVRWTHPGNESVVLRVVSHKIEQAPDERSDWLQKILPDHPGQVTILKEAEHIPAGDVLHLQNRTQRSDINAYLLESEDRLYGIILVAPLGTISDYSGVISKAVESFKTLM